MTARSKLFVAGVSVLIAVGVGVSRRSNGTSPCPPFTLVEMTGTLVEVRRDDMAVSADDPVMSVVPRVVCLSPQDGTYGAATVVVRDCYEPQYRAMFPVKAP
jgi:hypothetical protein